MVARSELAAIRPRYHSRQTLRPGCSALAAQEQWGRVALWKGFSTRHCRVLGARKPSVRHPRGRRGAPLCFTALGEWRNRQTRRIQVPVSARTWGFKSPLAHTHTHTGLPTKPRESRRQNPVEDGLPVHPGRRSAFCERVGVSPASRRTWMRGAARTASATQPGRYLRGQV
jgi:hypothetical protein